MFLHPLFGKSFGPLTTDHYYQAADRQLKKWYHDHDCSYSHDPGETSCCPELLNKNTCCRQVTNNSHHKAALK